jgi:hypothetical protein
MKTWAFLGNMFIFYKEKHSLKEHTHGEGTKCQNSTLPTLDKLILFRDIKWGNLFYPTLSFPNFFDMQYLNQFKYYYNFLFASNFDTLILFLIFDKKTNTWQLGESKLIANGAPLCDYLIQNIFGII